MQFLIILFLLLPCFLVSPGPPLFTTASTLEVRTASVGPMNEKGECSCMTSTKPMFCLEIISASLGRRTSTFPPVNHEERHVKEREEMTACGERGGGLGIKTVVRQAMLKKNVKYVSLENDSPRATLAVDTYVWMRWVVVVCCYLVTFGRN